MKMFFPYLVIFFFLPWGYAHGLSSEKYKILYINSYHTGYSWTDEVTKGLMAHFSERDSFLVLSEFLDAIRHSPDNAEKWFLPYLNDKYQNTRFDLIIASDNSALDLVLKHNQHALFKNVPVVFCGVSNPEDYPINDQDLYGVVEIDMFVASFDMMRRLIPDFKKVYLFTDRTTTGHVYRANAENLIKNYTGYDLIVMDSVYYDHIDSLMQTIDGNSVVFYQGISLDGDGRSVDNMAMARIIFKTARVPVFSSYAIDIDGALGGMFIDGTDHGKMCGQIAEKRLKGLPIKNRLNVPPIQGIYDYSKLMKYNLNPGLLPAGTRILNKPESIWTKYRNIIIGNILVIAILILLVVVLFRYNASQFKAKQMLEKAMEKAYESDRLKGAFLANVSHELRTPLNAICGFSELVKIELGESLLSNYVDVIYKNSDLLARLVNDLLDISLIDANAMVVNKSNINLDELFTTLEQQAKSALKLKEKTHISVELKTNPTYGQVVTDDFRVSQIMMNFINNAAKYTEKGQIVLGYDHINNLAKKLKLPHYDEAYLVLYVKDTGIGIEPDKIQMVFERFRSVDSKFMSQHGGVGLGLNISKSLAELLGGSIFVKSQKGRGSVFGFLLPL